MGSKFTYLDSVNSTMDEVKALIVNQQVKYNRDLFIYDARAEVL